MATKHKMPADQVKKYCNGIIIQIVAQTVLRIDADAGLDASVEAEIATALGPPAPRIGINAKRNENSSEKMKLLGHVA